VVVVVVVVMMMMMMMMVVVVVVVGGRNADILDFPLGRAFDTRKSPCGLHIALGSLHGRYSP